MGVKGGIERNVKTVDILRKNLYLQGIFVGSREMQKQMGAFFETHQIHPLISHRFGKIVVNLG